MGERPGGMRRNSVSRIVLAALPCLVLAPGAEAQATRQFIATHLAGASLNRQEARLPASPVVSSHAVIELRSGDDNQLIGTYIGGGLSLVATGVHNADSSAADLNFDVRLTGRLGLSLGSPGSPHLFGFGGMVFPKHYVWDPASRSHLASQAVTFGAGLGLAIRNFVMEGRLVFDRRYSSGENVSFEAMIGYRVKSKRVEIW